MKSVVFKICFVVSVGIMTRILKTTSVNQMDHKPVMQMNLETAGTPTQS